MMCITYFAEDFEYYDYKPWFIGNDVYRGVNNVKDIRGEKYCIILGAAQTFGRRSNVVFSELIERECGTKFINLSHGGNSPENILSKIDSHKQYREIILHADTIILQLMSPKNTRDDKGRYAWHPGAQLSFPEGDKEQYMYIDFWRKYIKKHSESAFLDLWYDIQLKYVIEMQKLTKFFSKKTRVILLNLFRSRPSGHKEPDNKYIIPFPHVYPRILDLTRRFTDYLVNFDISPYPAEKMYYQPNKNAKFNLKELENKISMRHFMNMNMKANRPKSTPTYTIYPTKKAHQDLAKVMYDYFS